MLTGTWWGDSLLMLFLLCIPVVVLWLVFRKPTEGPVPRDALSSRGKAQSSGLGLLVWPTRSYHETLIDDADDASADSGRPRDSHDGRPDDDG